ncbi:MAG: hypothetical protein H6695_18215 [Deferribacteres bacterium]|nr:hypothetical protein [candidate division KSB1 bacterium]MCB9512120.1 hypothetical protein [Deferribacteres bacterium]
MANTKDWVANINKQGERRRFWGGLIALAFGIAAALYLASQGMSRWWRLLLIFPFIYASFGILQAREKT